MLTEYIFPHTVVCSHIKNFNFKFIVFRPHTSSGQTVNAGRQTAILCAVRLSLSFAPLQWGTASSHHLPTSIGILHIQWGRCFLSNENNSSKKLLTVFLLQSHGLINFLWVLGKYWLLSAKGEVCHGSIQSKTMTPAEEGCVPITCCSKYLQAFCCYSQQQTQSSLHTSSLLLFWFLHLLEFTTLPWPWLQFQPVLLFLGLLTGEPDGCLSQNLKRWCYLLNNLGAKHKCRSCEFSSWLICLWWWEDR